MKITAEVMINPTIDLMGNKKWYWQVVQEYSNGTRITLKSGFEHSYGRACNELRVAGQQYVK